MFELLTVFVFIWLMGKAVGLAFKLTWGMTKFAASVLMLMAFPALFVSVLFLGGIALLIPIGLIGAAVWILSACLE